MKSIGSIIFSKSVHPDDSIVSGAPDKVCDTVWDNISVIIRQSIVESVRDIAYEAN